MPRNRNGYDLQAFENEVELEDGRMLTLRYRVKSLPGTFYDPPESEAGETKYWIDGVEVDDSEIPLSYEELQRLEEDARDVTHLTDFNDPE